MRAVLLFLACWVVSLACVTPASAAEGLDPQTRQLWERHWRVYAQNCAEFEGEYVCCPAYDRRYPSSAGISVRQAEAKLTETVKIDSGNMIISKTVKMPIGEAQAMAMPIPKLAVGEYGYLVSAEVAEVLGPTSIIIENLYLIDAQRLRRDYTLDRARVRRADDADRAEAELEYMYSRREALVERQKDRNHRKVILRLEGFPTRGLTEGQRWEGPKDEGIQFAIVRAEHYGSERRPKQRLVGVALSELRFGLDEAAFIELLESRGLDPSGFVKLVMDTMGEHDPDTAREMIFDSLLPTLPDPESTKQAKGDEKTDRGTDEGEDNAEGPDNKSD